MTEASAAVPAMDDPKQDAAERTELKAGPKDAQRPRRSSLLSLASYPSSLSDWSVGLGDLFALQPRDAVAVVQQQIEDTYVVKPIELGSGEIGVIRALQCKGTGEKRAVKTVLHEKIRDKAAFYNQLVIGARARHPHVVRLLEVFESEDCVHLVMEKCAGGNLHQKIFTRSSMRSNGLPLKTVVPYIAQMLKSIAYLHHYRIAHRDIKPSHYLLVDDVSDTIKLTDFSSARVFRKDGVLSGRSGSAPYFAPEVLEEQYNCMCDVWSVGIVTYMLITGRYPLPADSFEAYEEMLKERRGIDFEGKEWSAYKDEGMQLVQALLAWNPEERPPAKKLLRNPWLKSRGMPRRCCVLL